MQISWSRLVYLCCPPKQWVAANYEYKASLTKDDFPFFVTYTVL